MFYAFIAIFLPSVLALKLFDYLNKGISLKNSFYYYAVLLLISSFVNNILSYFLFNMSSNIIDSFIYPIFFSKYILMSIIVNILIMFIIIVLKNNVKFEINVKKSGVYNEKNRKKKKIS